MNNEAIILVAPDGRRFNVPTADGVARLKAKGFRDLTDVERKDDEMQQKYGEGFLPPIAAAASGAASSLSLGLSDVALARTPLAEANREVVARNPMAHTVGEVGALAVPIAAPLLGAAKVGKIAGAGLTTLGKVAGAVGETAGGVAELAGLAKVAPIVKGAAIGATEAAAFQTGANIGQAARRDVDLDAETILAHTGEAAILGAGIGAILPAAATGTRWTAEKAIAGLEKGLQGLRAVGFGGADLGAQAIEAGAGVMARNAEAIGETVASGARGAAGMMGHAASLVAEHAEPIAEDLTGIGEKIGTLAHEALLPKIREGLIKQTGRPDIINEVFANTPEAQALRKHLGTETITGIRQHHAAKIGESLNELWSQSLSNKPMFDDMAIAVKRELQSSELGRVVFAQREVLDSILEEAAKTEATLGKYSTQAQTFFNDSLHDFSKIVAEKSDAESIYRGIDSLKAATDKISAWSEGALGDASIGAQAAGSAAREFRTFAKKILEDENIWGTAGQAQQEVNASYSRFSRAFDAFEKNFAAPKAKGQPVRVLDGGKIKKFAKDITNQAGDVRNAVIDDLVSSQSDLIAVTERIAQKVDLQTRDAIMSHGVDRQAIEDALSSGRSMAKNIAETKSTAAREIERAEVLQQTQNAILSRQGAGVNPLPVDLLRRVGGGTLLGGVIGGLPGAVIGGGITSVLEKYGALTTNPKSAIQFLNQLDRMRIADKKRVADWIRGTLDGIGQGAESIAAKIKPETISEATRRGAEAIQEAVPGMRETLGKASKATAKKILEGRRGLERGIAAVAERAEPHVVGAMVKLLPLATYIAVNHGSSEEWWRRTQKTLITAQANTVRFADSINQETSGLYGDMPEMASAIARQKMRVVGFLVDRMPKNPRSFVLGEHAWQPNPEELKAFSDLVLVSTNPSALLPLITTGLATRAQVDAVHMLWPKKFEETKHQVIRAVTQAAEDNKPVSYQARLQIGQLLGVPLDPTQEPGFAQWVQEASTPQQSPKQQVAQGEQEEGKPLKRKLSMDTKTSQPLSMQTAMRKK